MLKSHAREIQIYMNVSKIYSSIKMNAMRISLNPIIRRLKYTSVYSYFSISIASQGHEQEAEIKVARLFIHMKSVINIHACSRVFYEAKKMVEKAIKKYHAKQAISYLFIEVYWNLVVDTYKANIQRYKSLPFVSTLEHIVSAYEGVSAYNNNKKDEKESYCGLRC